MEGRIPTPPSPQAPGHTAGLIAGPELGRGRRFGAGALASCFMEGLPRLLAWAPAWNSQNGGDGHNGLDSQSCKVEDVEGPKSQHTPVGLGQKARPGGLISPQRQRRERDGEGQAL